MNFWNKLFVNPGAEESNESFQRIRWNIPRVKPGVLFPDIRLNPYNFPEPLNSLWNALAPSRICPLFLPTGNQKVMRTAPGENSWKIFQMKILARHLEALVVTRPTFKLPFVHFVPWTKLARDAPSYHKEPERNNSPNPIVACFRSNT